MLKNENQEKSDAAQTLVQMRQQLLSYIRQSVNDEEVAEDLFQEVCLRGYRILNSEEGISNPTAWLFRVARNLVIDHFRNLANRPLVSAPLAITETNLDTNNLNAAVAQWVAEAMSELPPIYSEALKLSDLEGLSQAAVAQRLGISLTAAKSRIRRGRAQVHDIILACCDLEFDTHGNVVDFEQRNRGDCGCQGC